MKKVGRLIPSFLSATAPAMNDLLLQFLKSGSTDQQFVEKVRNVVFSKDALLAAKTLSLYDAKKVINKLDKALDVATIAQNKNLWKGCLKFLCRICGHHNLLPRSYKLTFALQKGDKPVGSGGFAEIWRGFYNGQRVAVKVLRVYEADNIEEIRKRFYREVLMWNRRPHPNILPLIGVSDSKDEFIMVSEWMENGNIREYVLAHPEENRPSMLLGAIEGLMYLHHCNIIHGDLKGANILIKQDGTSCLADFGLTTIIPTEASSFLYPPSTSGTIRWMSPERMNANELQELQERSVHSDCYAFGMVIYEALSGKIPFHLLSDPAVVAKVLSGGRPEEPIDTPAATHTSGLWSIVQQCWEEKPTKRPALSEVRDRLFVAAGMWDVDLGRSGSTDGFESVRQNVLLSSWDFSDAERGSELEGETSPFSFMHCSLYSTPERSGTPASVNRGRPRNQSPHHRAAAPPRNGGRMRPQSWYAPSLPQASDGFQPRFCGSMQNLEIPMQPNGRVGRVQEGFQSGDVESESDLEPLEPPGFVYESYGQWHR